MKKNIYPYVNIFIAIILVILFVSSIKTNSLECETLNSFYQRQHALRVEIIQELISNTSQKEVLIAINKVVKTKVALLQEDYLISTDIDIQPLIKDPVSFGEFFKRFSFWLFCIIIALLLDGTLTFGTFLFNDVPSLQETILTNFSKISSNNDLVNDLYDVLNSLELFKDDFIQK